MIGLTEGIISKTKFALIRKNLTEINKYEIVSIVRGSNLSIPVFYPQSEFIDKSVLIFKKKYYGQRWKRRK